MRKEKISITAWIVIQCLIHAGNTRRWGALVSDSDRGFYKKCSDDACNSLFACRALNAIPTPIKLWLIEKTVARGAPLHFIMRKRAIREQALASIAGGVSQIVVLGGGFDLLACNTAKEFPQITTFELDMPYMSAHKLRLLRQYKGELPVNFNAIGADLSQISLAEVLSRNPSFDPQKPTLFVAEGLTMYLSESDIKTLFADFKSFCKGPVSVMFTAIEAHREKKGWRRIRDVVLASNSENFRWSMLQSNMAKFLESQGFTQKNLLTYPQLQQNFRTPRELKGLENQNGEFLIYAVARPAA